MAEQSNKLKILLIEQEAFLARIISRGLRKVGMEVKHVASGDVALELLAKDSVDALIVATNMYPMDGEAFCRRLQADQPDRTFPVFVMTDSAKDIGNRWNHWFSNFRVLDKPISLRLIVESIEKHRSQPA